jgi:hypothetical protein
MGEEVEAQKQKELVTFEFPIREFDGLVQMKNISPSIPPKFHGLTSEDLDTFFFEFGILYWSYDYSSNAQKLKLFPTTLK